MLDGGKGVPTKSFLITIPISGWMTNSRVVSTKPEARAERIEMVAMRVNFIVGRR